LNSCFSVFLKWELAVLFRELCILESELFLLSELWVWFRRETIGLCSWILSSLFSNVWSLS
jgi:hypothetical protein